MNNPEFSGKAQNSSNPSNSSGEDIPAALRDTPDTTSKERTNPLIWIIWGVAGFVILATISGFLFFLYVSKKNIDSQPTLDTTPGSINSQKAGDTIFGHIPYSEAPETELIPISSDRRIKMRSQAAQQFQAMTQAAQRAGVSLVSISGFRSIKDQEQVFFSLKAQRNQTAQERASVSAPPGYSEHHTGYAVDIGDGAAPAENLQTTFENTKAYKWLAANAARYNFEMSFPKDNPQGVSYEPWHWRFVGDKDSLETFYRAKNLK